MTKSLYYSSLDAKMERYRKDSNLQGLLDDLHREDLRDYNNLENQLYNQAASDSVKAAIKEKIDDMLNPHERARRAIRKELIKEETEKHIPIEVALKKAKRKAKEELAIKAHLKDLKKVLHEEAMNEESPLNKRADLQSVRNLVAPEKNPLYNDKKAVSAHMAKIGAMGGRAKGKKMRKPPKRVF